MSATRRTALLLARHENETRALRNSTLDPALLIEHGRRQVRELIEHAAQLEREVVEGRKRSSAAQAVVDAYRSRFESPAQPNGIFGPIDGEIVALDAALRAPDPSENLSMIDRHMRP